jgi:hypothetical protein
MDREMLAGRGWGPLNTITPPQISIHSEFSATLEACDGAELGYFVSLGPGRIEMVLREGCVGKGIGGDG